MDNHGITGNRATGWLKMIALAAMIVDHIGAVLFPLNIGWRIVGRISFPLYCWCLAVGACYTRSMGKYLLRMAVMGVISQPFFVVVLRHGWTSPNIFLTLALALCGIWGLREKKWGSQFWAPVLVVCAGHLAGCSYGWRGVLLPMLLYLTRGNRIALAAVFTAFCLTWDPDGQYVGYLLGVDVSIRDQFLWSVVSPWFRLQNMAVWALPFMLIRFPHDVRIPGWINYVLYPAHLGVLYGIKLLIK